VYKSVEVIDKRTGRTVARGRIIEARRWIIEARRFKRPVFGGSELRLTLDTGYEVILVVVEVGNRAEP